MNYLEAFLGSLGLTSLWAKSPPHNLSALTEIRICLNLPPTGLNRDVQHPDGLPSCVPPSVTAHQVVQEYQPAFHRLRLSASA
jgi:hypothetical protein